MRFDKLTTKFQQALADAQSLALGNDNGFIEPQHLLAALLARRTAARRRCSRAPASPCPGCKRRSKASIERLPKVEGQGGEISVSRDLNNLLNLTDKEATSAATSSSPASSSCSPLADDKGETGRLLKETGLDPQGARERDRGGARRRAASTRRKPKASARR